tara:strand:+ start:24 stop:251 length:228 start_codon:yes stop_codon:yes gene_type:complete
MKELRSWNILRIGLKEKKIKKIIFRWDVKMSKKFKWTTITVKKDTKLKLYDNKKMDETWDDLFVKLLLFYNLKDE